MSYYDEVYLKRLNRYGIDYQSRIQGQRERVFEDLLLKSIYRVDFEYNHEMVPGILERYKQDETQTMQYLLLRESMDIPSGTILRIPNKNYSYGEPLTDDNSYYWMIYYLENIKASGYNRYIVLKMTHKIKWKNRQNEECSALGYFYGQEDNMLKDEIKSRSRNKTLYNENLKLSFFVTPVNANIKKEDYFEISTVDHNGKELIEAYRVTGYDIQSTPGVEFVSVDPVYIRDNTPAPEQWVDDNTEDFFWINGGQYDESNRERS